MNQVETPFDNVENAQEYVRLLSEAVAEAKRDLEADIAAATDARYRRRLEAQRLALYKLEKLEQHLKASGRMLNDLRTLRRLLFEERHEPAAVNQERTAKE